VKDRDDGNQDVQTDNADAAVPDLAGHDDLTTAKPHKPLLAVRKRTGGRRNTVT